MKFIIQIVLCSVIGGLAQNCGNDGSSSLSNCLNNPNIRIQKIQNDIRGYRLSLYSQNAWWTAENKLIECKELCEVCRSLPGISKNSENIWPAIQSNYNSMHPYSVNGFDKAFISFIFTAWDNKGCHSYPVQGKLLVHE